MKGPKSSLNDILSYLILYLKWMSFKKSKKKSSEFLIKIHVFFLGKAVQVFIAFMVLFRWQGSFWEFCSQINGVNQILIV